MKYWLFNDGILVIVFLVVSNTKPQEVLGSLGTILIGS